MKKKTCLLIQTAALMSVFVGASPALNAQIYSEDFQSGYTAGDLAPQNGWAPGFGATTATATVVNNSGNFELTSSANAHNILDAGNFGLTASDSITLNFELVAGAANSLAVFGIGNYDPSNGGKGASPFFGVQNGNWLVRGFGNGTAVQARDSGGNTINPVTGKRYAVESVWDLSGDGLATLAIKNLTDGETSYTTLYFNSAQTQTEAALGLSNEDNPGVANWEGVYLRTTNSGVADNLSIIPESSSIAFIVSGLSGLFILIRRKRS